MLQQNLVWSVHAGDQIINVCVNITIVLQPELGMREAASKLFAQPLYAVGRRRTPCQLALLQRHV